MRTEALPGVRYMDRTKQHVQMVCDGVVIDQNYMGLVKGYWGKRKFVTHVTQIQED